MRRLKPLQQSKSEISCDYIAIVTVGIIAGGHDRLTEPILKEKSN
jgi:hypothetical protein